ncbi:MAG: restriction endonuclease [Candidatus Nealsonbacteria bacterium]|nr:MAG: restriction endonuclease [Candidatus Nealsonbacteria bacterium]
MNKWVKKSINLANSRGYLDRLFEVYPIEMGAIRGLPKGTKAKVKNVLKTKNKLHLIETLLKLSKFPIDDPYIASLRRHPHLLKKNPKTIKRIGKRLLSMGLGTILKLVAKPKSPSRQLGHSFKNWLLTKKYPFLKENEFKETNKVAFLEGSDKKLKEFVINELKIRSLKRRPDFILKTKNKFILGEAKFLTDYGGTQNNQFDGALTMTKIKRDKIIGIAVLDGIAWFKSNSYMYKTLNKLNRIAISALLLEEFIKKGP